MTKMKKFWVYVHTCPNGKRYVGCTKQARPKRRWVEGRGYYQNEHFYRAILKYGWDNIKHEFWELTCESEMYYAEKYLIAYYHTTESEFGYNHTAGGPLGSKKTGPRKPVSEETRKKMSEIKKGKHHKPFSLEARKHMSETARNRPRISIKLPDGTIVEMTKQNLTRNYVNKGRKFEYVS